MSSAYAASTSSITVQVLFFGATAEATGMRETKIEINTGSTVGDAHASLLDSFPKLQRLNVKFAVDREHCSGYHALADGEELAIFTAVSGG